jgi:hypothetical protein
MFSSAVVLILVAGCHAKKEVAHRSRRKRRQTSAAGSRARHDANPGEAISLPGLS